MLTDDDLTRQLGAAFRGVTDDLAYTGQAPTPRSRGAVLGVPLVATAATVTTLAGVWLAAPDTGSQPAPPSAGPATASPIPEPSEPELVTETFEVAGYTFRAQHAPGTPVADVLHIAVLAEVPAGARPVEVEPPSKAWVGTDPESGDAVMYLQAPSRLDGRILGVSLPGYTEAQMERILLTGIG